MRFYKNVFLNFIESVGLGVNNPNLDLGSDQTYMGEGRGGGGGTCANGLQLG